MKTSRADRSVTAEQLIEFACPYCGQQGWVAWSGKGKDRQLARLTNGFHVEEGRLPGARQIIVCDHCDEIDPPRVSSPLA